MSKNFEPLIGEWHGEGVMPIDPPMKIAVEATVERLGEFFVLRSKGRPADVPDSVSIIGGAPDGDPQGRCTTSTQGSQGAVPDDARRLHV